MDFVSATSVIDAPIDDVFAVLADPAKHAAIDGTGWVTAARDVAPLTTAGQIFRMSMYHPNHPDGDYETINEVLTFEPPTAISWRPGYEDDGGTLRFGGWIWRYDLVAAGPSTTQVTLTYDWSAVADDTREHIGFPPFPREHLANSLAHLAGLAR